MVMQYMYIFSYKVWMAICRFFSVLKCCFALPKNSLSSILNSLKVKYFRGAKLPPKLYNSKLVLKKLIPPINPHHHCFPPTSFLKKSQLWQYSM